MKKTFNIISAICLIAMIAVVPFSFGAWSTSCNTTWNGTCWQTCTSTVTANTNHDAALAATAPYCDHVAGDRYSEVYESETLRASVHCPHSNTSAPTVECCVTTTWQSVENHMYTLKGKSVSCDFSCGPVTATIKNGTYNCMNP